MHSDIYLLDYYANTGNTIFHHASAISKLVFVTGYLLLIVFSYSIPLLAFFTLMNILLCLLSRINPSYLLKLVLYPFYFAAFFALSQLPNYTLATVTILRVIATVTLMVFLIATTKYTYLFSILGKLSPTFATVLLLTYTFLFIFIDMLESMWNVMKIRGHDSASFTRKLKNIGNLLALIFIRTITEAEKIYNIMVIRGFKGRIMTLSSDELALKKNDMFLIMLIVIIGGGIWLSRMI